MNLKFTKNYRIIKSSDFSDLKSKSRFLFSNSLLGFYSKNDLEHSRLGLSISRKFGNAVRRNRLKRKIREIYRKSDCKNQSIDINIVPNLKYLKKINFNYSLYEKDLERDFLKLFKKI
ncbi:MAG: ribonuclease P protein component [Bacteriovoracaceae bacterium]|nr:ribonuclease P protein component [Bacteriovoracaceae bacterium]